MIIDNKMSPKSMKQFEGHHLIRLAVICIACVTGGWAFHAGVISSPAIQMRDHDIATRDLRIKDLEGQIASLQGQLTKFEDRQKALVPSRASHTPPGYNGQTRQQRITLIDEVAAPDSGPSRQAVILAVRPQPVSGDILQVWIKQGNNNWYRCQPAQRLSDIGHWKAICMFGYPESTNPNYRAKHGQSWFSYGVFSFRNIGSDIIPDETPDIYWKKLVSTYIKSEPAIIPATYQGQ